MIMAMVMIKAMITGSSGRAKTFWGKNASDVSTHDMMLFFFAGAAYA